MKQSGLSFCPCASRRTSFLLLTFPKSHAGFVSSFFPFLVHCSLCIQNLHRLWHRKKRVHQIVMCQRSKSFSCNAIFVNFGLQRFQGQKQWDPTSREQESRLISIQRPKRWFRILLNCAKLKFVSYTSNWLEQMYDFQKRTTFHLT